MSGYGWVSLTTDYGRSDGFVAACHGVIARIAPAVRVIDVTHEIPPADVTRGAAVLAQTVGYLPPAVHVAVVDPGVGTARRGIAVGTPGGLLVGPDNGLLPWAAETLGGVTAAVELTNPAWFPAGVSATFHGRDVFAPAAARLALGAPLSAAGTAIDPASLVRLPEPAVATGDGWLEAQVLTVDHFGNVQLAAPAATLARLGRALLVARALPPEGALPAGSAVPAGTAPSAGRLAATRGATFGEVPVGELVVFPDSAGLVAIAVNTGRADQRLGVAPGEIIRIADDPDPAPRDTVDHLT